MLANHQRHIMGMPLSFRECAASERSVLEGAAPPHTPGIQSVVSRARIHRSVWFCAHPSYECEPIVACVAERCRAMLRVCASGCGGVVGVVSARTHILVCV